MSSSKSPLERFAARRALLCSGFCLLQLLEAPELKDGSSSFVGLGGLVASTVSDCVASMVSACVASTVSGCVASTVSLCLGVV